MSHIGLLTNGLKNYFNNLYKNSQWLPPNQEIGFIVLFARKLLKSIILLLSIDNFSSILKLIKYFYL